MASRDRRERTGPLEPEHTAIGQTRSLIRLRWPECHAVLGAVVPDKLEHYSISDKYFQSERFDETNTDAERHTRGRRSTGRADR
ncbi:hypothetical protein C486_08163 [Natrinema gari JCM 14663]|uniref:Uncharacterized protein n=1 Tax=Natrinema gari JCM 14663 TaxID=1230459 RepID=L9Z5X3_9EURY|nr:hypothetical protein C486_08163 [Natrinema gari JCM 14663]